MNTWNYVPLLGLSVCLGVIHPESSEREDERTIPDSFFKIASEVNQSGESPESQSFDRLPGTEVMS
jgi:hypothetical protein